MTAPIATPHSSNQSAGAAAVEWEGGAVAVVPFAAASRSGSGACETSVAAGRSDGFAEAAGTMAESPGRRVD
jgi:hypothetical protein